MRMSMAKCVDRHAGSEIKVALAVSREQPRALPSLESQIDARIGWQQVGGHGAARSRWWSIVRTNGRKTQCAASLGGTRYIVLPAGPVSTMLVRAFSLPRSGLTFDACILGWRERKIQGASATW